MLTLRLRQLLQFIASLGSLLGRRTGRRSMPICGRDIMPPASCSPPPPPPPPPPLPLDAPAATAVLAIASQHGRSGHRTPEDIPFRGKWRTR